MNPEQFLDRIIAATRGEAVDLDALKRAFKEDVDLREALFQFQKGVRDLYARLVASTTGR